jgi:hypothetical protein
MPDLNPEDEMKKIGFAAALAASLLAAGTAQAQRPSTLNMTCAQAQSFVASRKAVVMTTGRHTFQRFVVIPGYCPVGDYAYPAYAPTRDARSCRLGYRCDPIPPLYNRGFLAPRGRGLR